VAATCTFDIFSTLDSHGTHRLDEAFDASPRCRGSLSSNRALTAAAVVDLVR
jgi:hypothetical protein